MKMASCWVSVSRVHNRGQGVAYCFENYKPIDVLYLKAWD